MSKFKIAQTFSRALFSLLCVTREDDSTDWNSTESNVKLQIVRHEPHPAECLTQVGSLFTSHFLDLPGKIELPAAPPRRFK